MFKNVKWRNKLPYDKSYVLSSASSSFTSPVTSVARVMCIGGGQCGGTASVSSAGNGGAGGDYAHRDLVLIAGKTYPYFFPSSLGTERFSLAPGRNAWFYSQSLLCAHGGGSATSSAGSVVQQGGSGGVSISGGGILVGGNGGGNAGPGGNGNNASNAILVGAYSDAPPARTYRGYMIAPPSAPDVIEFNKGGYGLRGGFDSGSSQGIVSVQPSGSLGVGCGGGGNAGAQYSASLGGAGTIFVSYDYNAPVIPSPELWLKADSLSLNNNDPVSVWLDSSGNGYHVSQSNASRRPVYKTSVADGMPGVLFDGVDDFLSNASPVTGSTVFLVANFVSGSATTFSGYHGAVTIIGDKAGPFVTNNSGTEWTTDWDVSSLNTYIDYATNKSRDLAPIQEFHLSARYSATYNGADYGNGVRVGRDRDFDFPTYGQRHWSGHICEVIFYNRRLSSAEFDHVRLYLNMKYNTF